MPHNAYRSLGKRLLVLGCLAAASCTQLPSVPPNNAVRVPSPNFDERRPNCVVLHQTTDNTADEALDTLTDPARKVSAHYLIGRDGTLYRLVDESRRAWHAGVSYWGGNTDMNSASIGIELDNNGDEPFAEAAIARLLALLSDLKARYRIPQANFVGHGDIAPGRKVDPSAWFPWARLAAAGYGLWCPLPSEALPGVAAGGVEEVNGGLQILGYNAADPTAALAAFRRHFWGIESTAPPDRNDAAMLACLIQARSASPAPP